MWHNGSLLLGKFQIIIWDFPNSDLQEIHFHTFYPLALLLLWRFALSKIILISYLGDLIVLCLCFLYLRITSEIIKIYGKHLWMGLTPSQVWDWFFKILIGVCSSTECLNTEFVWRQLLLNVFKFVLSRMFFNCI